MADNVWQKGKLTMVMHPVGTREENQEPKYKRGLYDLLEWTPPGGAKAETYILPTGNEVPSVNIAGQQDHQLGTEFGYYTGNIMFLDVHEASGQDSGWSGCHSFGHI